MKQPDHHSTILALCAALTALGLYLKSSLFFWIALVLALTGLFLPLLAAQLAKGWLKATQGIGWVMSRVLLTLIYYLILTPLALMARLFSRNPLQLKRKAEGSYFIERNAEVSAKDLEKPW